jgi:DNA invertase Pin-like site-specific DNA recombinase
MATTTTDSTGGRARTFVSYLRVSTDKQGRSALGLEAQQAAISAFLRSDDTVLAPPYVEVESGKNADRPKLRDAIARCRKTGATLLIAKLDRLARDVHFIAGLMKEGVPFLACDMPTATPFMLHVYAAVAEEDARSISRRTKAALAAAKARGVKLGGDRGYRPTTPPDWTRGVPASSAARAERADHTAHALLPTIEAIRNEGIGSLSGIATTLNARSVTAPRGGQWTATTVRRLLARVATECAMSEAAE